MNTIVKAGAEGLIWLVVGVFWVIAQIAGAAAKKKMPPPNPFEEEEGEAPVDPFAELMRKFASVQEFNIPAPPEPEWIEDTPEAAFESSLAWKAGDIAALPDIQPLKRVPLPPIEEVSKIEEVDIRPTMRAFRNTLPSMKLPSMRLHFQCAPHHDRDVDSGKVAGRADRLELQNPKTLRRAMLSHIIFSPPKALEKM